MAEGKRSLKIEFIGDDKDATRAMRSIEGALGGLEKGAHGAGISLGTLAVAAAGVAAAVGGAVIVGKQLIGSFFESEVAAVRLKAVLRATGAEWFTSAQQIQGFSTELQHATGISDEEITNLQTLLLTFREIGPEVFQRTTEAALDMSLVFGQEVSGSAIQLGKALQDPIQGVTALRRVGVQMSDAQEELIKKFVESGEVLKAQEIILEEVEHQVGGVAREMGETGAAKVNRFANAIDDLKESLGEALFEGLEPLLDEAIAWAESDEARQFTQDLAQDIQDLGSALGDARAGVQDLHSALADVVNSGPFQIAIELAGSGAGLIATLLGAGVGGKLLGPGGALIGGGAGLVGSSPSTGIGDRVRRIIGDAAIGAGAGALAGAPIGGIGALPGAGIGAVVGAIGGALAEAVGRGQPGAGGQEIGKFVPVGGFEDIAASTGANLPEPPPGFAFDPNGNLVPKKRPFAAGPTAGKTAGGGGGGGGGREAEKLAREEAEAAARAARGAIVGSLLKGAPTGAFGVSPFRLPAETVAEFDAIQKQYTELAKGLKRAMAEMGLTMADLEITAGRDSEAFQEAQNRMDALRDAASRLDLMEELQLDPWRGEVEKMRDAIDEAAEASKRAAEELARLAEEGMALAAGIANRGMGAGVALSAGQATALAEEVARRNAEIGLSPLGRTLPAAATGGGGNNYGTVNVIVQHPPTAQNVLEWQALATG